MLIREPASRTPVRFHHEPESSGWPLDLAKVWPASAGPAPSGDVQLGPASFGWLSGARAFNVGDRAFMLKKVLKDGRWSRECFGRNLSDPEREALARSDARDLMRLRASSPWLRNRLPRAWHLWRSFSLQDRVDGVPWEALGPAQRSAADAERRELERRIREILPDRQLDTKRGNCLFDPLSGAVRCFDPFAVEWLRHSNGRLHP